jgi:predicted Zn finger-like uncharacterized protein
MWAEAAMNLTCPNCSARFKIKDGALGTKGRKVKCGKCEHRWHAMPEAVPAPAAAVAPTPADPTEDFAPPPPPPPPVADPTDAPPPPPPPVPQAAPAEDDLDDDDPGVDDPGVDENYDDEDDDEIGVPDAMLADPPPIPPESSFVPRNRNPEPQSGGTLKYWILLVLIIVGSSGVAFWSRDIVVHHFPAANKVFMMVGFPANTLGYGLKIYEPKTFLDVKGKKRILGVTGQIMNETGKIIEVPLLKAILIGSKGEDLAGWSFEAKEPRILPGEKVDYETATENPPRGATGLRITFTRAEEEEAMKGEKMSKEPAK